MNSTLKFGSTGPAVKQLQSLLNQSPSALGKIGEDGNFGQQTRLRVIEFQGKRGLTPDGIVGAATWTALLGSKSPGSPGASGNPSPPAPGPAAVPGSSDTPPAPGSMPANEAAARERIVQCAIQNFNKYGGWKPGVDKADAADPRVAGKLCADRSTRLRQGGKAIMDIFTVAGGPAPQRCLTLTPQAESMYQRQYTAQERNNTDIVSWCGIFSLYVHKSVGLRLSSWPLKYSIGKPKPQDEYRVVTWPQPGDIGVVNPMGLNHHFVVVAADASGITSVDGNSGMLMEIVKKNSSKSDIKGKQGYFLTPIWENVLG
ncbi:MAG TPA: peptidoglycan-binding domain-containing protein [Bryobacteraceae bacterium]|nr:peptidoglycan-binding domain-containing protein [Bryobacteraceae bacterium]